MNPGQRYVSGQAIVAGQKLSRLLSKGIVLFHSPPQSQLYRIVGIM
jgi:hypothetical protein